jgi:hypothetical protein
VAPVQHEAAEDGDHDGDEPVDAEGFNRAAGGVAQQVGEEPDGSRPCDPAERVP